MDTHIPYIPERSPQGKQPNCRGILPLRLTSSGTDAGGVQPAPLITQSQTTGGEWKWSAVLEGVRTHVDTNCCFTSLHPNHSTKPSHPTPSQLTKAKDGWGRLSHPVCVHPTPLIYPVWDHRRGVKVVSWRGSSKPRRHQLLIKRAR